MGRAGLALPLPMDKAELLPIRAEFCIPITSTAAVAEGCAHRDSGCSGTHGRLIKDREIVVCCAWGDLMQITMFILWDMRDGPAMGLYHRGTRWQAEGEIEARSTIIFAIAGGASV